MSKDQEIRDAIRASLKQRGHSDEQSKATSESLESSESLGSIVGGKFEDRNPLMAILDVLSIGQQAAVGLVKEQGRRNRGLEPISRVSQMKSAIHESASFGQLTGNPFTGFLLDVVLDPLNLLSFGGGKLIVKGLGSIPEIAAVARKARGAASAAGEALENVDQIRKIKVALGDRFKVGFMLRRVSKEELLDPRAVYQQNLLEAEHLGGRGINDVIERLVPTVEGRNEILDLLEIRPNFTVKPDADQIAQFRRRFAMLSPEERSAYRFAAKTLDEQETLKIASQLLPELQAGGHLEKIAPISHVPHHVEFSKGSMQDHFNSMAKNWDTLKAIEGTEAGAGITLPAVKRWKKVFDDIPEKLGKPSFTEARETTESVAELAGRGVKVERDIGKVLQAEQKSIDVAVATQEYMESIRKYVNNRGLAFTKEELRNEPMIVKALSEQFGDKMGKRILRDGFEKVDEIGGAMVPKAIAKEIRHVIKAYSDPEKVNEVLKAWFFHTRNWKAWTLAPILSYHSRNFISNLWNQSLAGMGPKAMIEHNYHAFVLRKQWGKGIFSDDIIPGIGFSSRELHRQSLRRGVMGTGHFAGEVGNALLDSGRARGGITRQLDYRYSKVIKKGYLTGQYIEDSNKIGTLLWRLSKGDNIDDATKVVHKHLFDYRHGLTEFEGRWLRDGLIPFYSFTRMNLPLQLENLIKQPHKFTNVYKVKREYEAAQGGPDPDRVVIADWIKDSANVRFGYNKKTETYNYMLFDSWWPAADIGRFLGSNAGKSLIGMAHPFPKLGAEIYYNYNIFQKRKIRAFPGEQKKLLGAQLPAMAEHLLRQVRVLNEIDRTLTFAMQGENFSDMFFRAIGRGALARFYPVDYAKQKMWWESKMRRDIIELKGRLKSAERRGDVKNARTLTEQIAKYEKMFNEHREPIPASSGTKKTVKKTVKKKI